MATKKQRFTFDTKQFAAMVKAKRTIELKITMAVLSKKLKMNASTICRIENEHRPDLQTFENVCEWLNVHPQVFFIDNKKA